MEIEVPAAVEEKAAVVVEEEVVVEEVEEEVVVEGEEQQQLEGGQQQQQQQQLSEGTQPTVPTTVPPEAAAHQLAATTVQRVARGYRARRSLQLQHRAAASIQRMVRAHTARQSLQLQVLQLCYGKQRRRRRRRRPVTAATVAMGPSSCEEVEVEEERKVNDDVADTRVPVTGANNAHHNDSHLHQHQQHHHSTQPNATITLRCGSCRYTCSYENTETVCSNRAIVCPNPQCGQPLIPATTRRTRRPRRTVRNNVTENTDERYAIFPRNQQAVHV